MTISITLTDDQVASVVSQDGTVATLQAKASALQTQLDAANAQVTTLTADRDAQKARADKVEARLATLNQDIDAVQAKD